MKFIHTADIRLDRCYVDQHLPSHVGRENRQHLRQRFLAILDHARKVGADGILIAGNLFERDRVERDTISFLRTAIEAIAPIPVIIAPGSWDPVGENSPYETEIWPKNAHIFSSAKWAPISVGDCTIYGFAHDKASMTSNPFDAFEVPEVDGPFIIMGSAVEATGNSGDEMPASNVDLARLAHPNLAYVALGQYPQCLDLSPSDDVLAWCSGAPAGSGFGDQGPHQILEVTIDLHANTPTSVTPTMTGHQRFLEIAVDCTDCASGQALIDAVRPRLLELPELQCVRIVLEGALLPDIYDEMTGVRETLGEDLAYLEIDDRCFVAEDFAALAAQKTSLGAFLARINLEIDDAPDEFRREALCRSRDLALCAYRGQHLPIRVAHGD